MTEASQEFTQEALEARWKVEKGQTLYRAGTRGASNTGKEAQYWSLESPFSNGYAEKYGIPKENLAKSDFIETAVIKAHSNFITRRAPPVAGNMGGAIEIVVPPGGVTITGHISL